MKWESLISTRNLKLAWQRINTGNNIQYKRFFRESYVIYEHAIDEYLKELHRELKEGKWSAKHATRVYTPKSSGLQRPMSLLGIEDQIVLQAIANKFASKLYDKRQKVESQSVFSNKLSQPRDSIFFIENWQNTYAGFQTMCRLAFDLKFRWSVQFDLAAYYDTISHELLLKILFPNTMDSESLRFMKKCFGKWSADNSKVEKGHGIPQGPIASNFLAEAFFLPIDIELQKKWGKFIYVRYVDDIRLFAKSENEVREAAIQLEQECRRRGLIPHGSKFEIRRLKTADEAMGTLPSIPLSNVAGGIAPSMTVEEAIRILNDKEVVGGKPLRVMNKSRFRYLMYRAPAKPQILKKVLMLIPRHPEHVDSFIAYLSHYKNHSGITKAILDYLEKGAPYSYVRGEFWHVIARCADIDGMKRGIQIAREDAKRRNNCVILSWGVMHFLMKCEEKGLIKNGNRLKGEHPISRSLLAPVFKDIEFKPGKHGAMLLKGNLMEQLAGAYEMRRRNITLNSLGLRQRNLPDTSRIALKSLGVIYRRSRQDIRDRINEDLKSLYGCRDIPAWRIFLDQDDYQHALQILKEAKSCFEISRSSWLVLQDSFNDLIVRRFFTFLESRGENGYSITDKNGNLIKYGVLIRKDNKFSRSYPHIAEWLSKIHDRRNKIPNSHPYNTKGGQKNKWLTKKERWDLVCNVKFAMDAIAEMVIKGRMS